VSVRRRAASAALTLYKRVLSPLLHGVSGATLACRFQPTCSEYAALAVSELGILRGSVMAVGRLLRCHPFHKGGFDPVPPKQTTFTWRSSQAITIKEPHSIHDR
jgi:putative membrane protein insertion efficiency factor